jgi:hypothetical protein
LGHHPETACHLVEINALRGASKMPACRFGEDFCRSAPFRFVQHASLRLNQLAALAAFYFTDQSALE